MQRLLEYLYTLLPFAISLTKNTWDAEDILQDVSINLIKHQEKIFALSWNEQQKYVMQSVKFKFIDTKRAQRAHKERFCNYKPCESELPSIDSKMHLKDVMNGINKLQEPLQRTTLLAFVYGFPVKEIAEAEGASINTVVSRTRYARRNLTKALALG